MASVFNEAANDLPHRWTAHGWGQSKQSGDRGFVVLASLWTWLPVLIT